MNGARILAITEKTLRALRHDPRTIALMLLAPIGAMLIFGFAFGNETSHVPVIVVNDDTGQVGAAFVAKLDHAKLDISESTDLSGAQTQVREGDKIAVLHIPTDFSRGGKLDIFLDTTNAQLSGAVVKSVADAGQALASSAGFNAPTPTISYAHPAAKDARLIDSFVPGIMAFAVTLFTTLLTLLAFVGERSNGTLDRLRVTPVTEAEIVLGYELAFGIIATIQGVLLLTVALLVYHVLVLGPLLIAGIIVVLLAIDAQAIGILISAAAQREGQAVQFIPLIILPVFLLSGIFVPVQTLPSWLQPVAYLLPPTWGIAAMRDVMLRGWGLEHVWPHLLVLAGFAIGFTLLAIIGLRRARKA